MVGEFGDPCGARGGWWCILAPGRQALSAPLSFHSVLDDEGTNLRQQKLDRQVSGAGADQAGWGAPFPGWCCLVVRVHIQRAKAGSPLCLLSMHWP